MTKPLGVLKAGETALQTLAKRFTQGNEAQVVNAIQQTQLIVAVKSGDFADLRNLVECQGADFKAKDHVCVA